MPVSILTTTSAAAVEQAHGSTIAIERFRANLVIQTEASDATERDWLGRSLAIGSEGTRLGVGGMIPRCAMVGIDAATGTRDPSVVRTVVQRFANPVGAHCWVQRPGTIRLGETVALAERGTARCSTQVLTAR